MEALVAVDVEEKTPRGPFPVRELRPHADQEGHGHPGQGLQIAAPGQDRGLESRGAQEAEQAHQGVGRPDEEDQPHGQPLGRGPARAWAAVRAQAQQQGHGEEGIDVGERGVVGGVVEQARAEGVQPQAHEGRARPVQPGHQGVHQPRAQGQPEQGRDHGHDVIRRAEAVGGSARGQAPGVGGQEERGLEYGRAQGVLDQIAARGLHAPRPGHLHDQRRQPPGELGQARVAVDDRGREQDIVAHAVGADGRPVETQAVDPAQPGHGQGQDHGHIGREGAPGDGLGRRVARARAPLAAHPVGHQSALRPSGKTRCLRARKLSTKPTAVAHSLAPRAEKPQPMRPRVMPASRAQMTPTESR